MLALHMFSSRRPRLCARLATAPSSQRPPTRPSSTRSGPSTNSTQPARASHFEQRGRRPACTGVPRRRPCRRGIGARGRRHPPRPRAPRRAAPRRAQCSPLLCGDRPALEAGARAPAAHPVPPTATTSARWLGIRGGHGAPVLRLLARPGPPRPPARAARGPPRRPSGCRPPSRRAHASRRPGRATRSSRPRPSIRRVRPSSSAAPSTASAPFRSTRTRTRGSRRGSRRWRTCAR